MPQPRLPLPLVSILLIGLATSPSTLAEPNIIHRYSFSEASGADTADSIGGADGEVKGNGFSWGGGELTLNGGASSNAAYVDLPNGLISGLTDVSFEAWTTNNGSQNWARIFDFGSTTGGEVTGPGGGGTGLDYIFLSASRGGNNNQQRLEIRNEDPGGGGINTADTNLASTNSTEYHHIVTYDADGAGAQAQLKYYRDGLLVGQTNSAIQLNQLNDVNNWLGRSNWTADANYAGSFNEFRIYDTVMEQTDVDESNIAGPDNISGGPTISSFTATPDASFEGDDVTLAWEIIDPTGALTVSIAPEPGAIAGNPATGNTLVAPLVTTTYTLTASDSEGERTRDVTVTVDPGIPVADDQSLATDEEVPINITLVANDPNNGTLAYSIVDDPVGGALSGTPPNVTYTPSAAFTGDDSFTFRANDGDHDSNLATVSITVYPAPQAPTDISLTSTEIPSTAVPGAFIATMVADDPNPQNSHSFALVAGAGDADNALFSVSANQLLAQASFAGEIGNMFSIRLRATDDTGRVFDKAFVLTAVEASTDVVINEIHYDPPDGSLPGEFIELFNPGTVAVDLSLWYFEDGIDFTIPGGTTLGPGEYLVVAQDPATALALYGVDSIGAWTGKLDSDGEQVTLRDSADQVIDEVDYKVGFPWPIKSSGDGGSMELLNPSLDNDLGSSWRSSFTGASNVPPENVTILLTEGAACSAAVPTSGSQDLFWHADFFDPGFPAGNTGVGYENAAADYAGLINFDLGPLSAPGSRPTSVYVRVPFTVDDPSVFNRLILRMKYDDGFAAYLNGNRITAAQANAPATLGWQSVATADHPDGAAVIYESFDISTSVGLLKAAPEVNILGIHVLNTSATSSDLLCIPELEASFLPTGGGGGALVSAGEENISFTNEVPPNIRQVDHVPQTPNDSEATTITAKVTDPQGVASVDLLYQILPPGQFIPARTPRSVGQIMADPEGDPPDNPAFENAGNWTTVAMVDDGTSGDLLAGDAIYAAVLPAQAHRTLVRYRIVVEDLGGASVRVPYPDDDSRNFAYFVYNGVPDYVASTASVHPDGPGHVWPKETLASVPVYHWIIRPQDMLTLQAYNGGEQFSNNGSNTELAARRAYDWEGAMVYDGVVYDHVRARLRGGNSRYGDFDGRFPRGKRHYKFRFNKGNYFEARDEKGRKYERPWRIFNVSRMFGTKGGNSWGLPEEIGDTLYHTMGVPTQRAHWFQFRVIDDAAEAPDQYHGDFWGLMQAQERYDVRFLDSRNMTKGNLYKLSDFMFDAERQRRYQALNMVSDGSEFDNIRDNLHGGQDATWLNRYVNYEKWYGYSAVGEAIRHYDIFPEPTGRHRMKNLVFYFEPLGPDPVRGWCWLLPYDYDASWGPNFNNGWDHGNNGLYGWVTVNGMPYINKPDMKIAHRNVLRSFRDLVWQRDQIEDLLDDRAAFISELTQADQDRWRNAPLTAGTANDDPLAFKVQDMKNFAFNGWSAPSGPAIGAGGRAAYIDSIANNGDAGQLPATPTVFSTGAANFPTDGLQFQCTPYSDPQGAATFAAMEWRIGEIEDPTAPAWDPADDFIMENDLIWGSGELAVFNDTLEVPSTALKVGHTYRARVRHKDSTGRWSHWSGPHQFTTTVPAILGDLQSNLMITEVMYHPGDPSTAEADAGFSESDFEYLELCNISDTLTLDLTDVRFTKGVDFDFIAGSITSLAPGEYVLVVRNAAAFEMRYGAGLPVAGEWLAGQNLSNGGEQLKLSHGSGTAIHDFVYDDVAPWPTTPDGTGVSMALADPPSAPDHALPESWRASFAPAGTPGTEESVSPFNQWMVDNGLSDPNGDPSASGLSNLLVYSLGGDLAPEESGAAPVATVVVDGANDYLAIEYRRRIAATDITYKVQLSDDLDVWQSDPGDNSITTPVSTVDNGDGTETVTIRATAPLNPGQRLYIRLMVTAS